MQEVDFLNEEIEEVIEGNSFIHENQEYDLFILKLKSEKYVLYFNIMNTETNEIAFNSIKEFNDLELAKKEFEFFKLEE